MFNKMLYLYLRQTLSLKKQTPKTWIFKTEQTRNVSKAAC